MVHGFGRGGGRGKGRRRGGGRRGGIKRREVAADRNCICPNCGLVLPHQRGVPCFETRCPDCGAAMTRQFNIQQATGSGQTTSTAPKPVVDPNLCTGCQKCVAVCPVDAIEMKNHKAVIIKEKCTNCRICITSCPVSAIK